MVVEQILPQVRQSLLVLPYAYGLVPTSLFPT
jgi:hypothetical protein